jgi:hypothetical protein
VYWFDGIGVGYPGFVCSMSVSYIEGHEVGISRMKLNERNQEISRSMNPGQGFFILTPLRFHVTAASYRLSLMTL